MKFLSAFLLFSMIDLFISKEIDLILSLQDYFNSKLLLVLKKNNYDFSENFVYDLMKRQKGKFYTGLVSNDKNSYTKESYSRFHETLLISFFDAEALINIIKNFKTHFLKSLVWIHFVKSDEDIKELEKIYIPYNCRFLIIKKIGENYELLEIYKLKEENKFIYLKFSNYENGLLPVLNFYKRRVNLHGFHFAMTASAYSAPEYKQNDIIWDYLEKKMNFTHTLVNSEPLIGAIYPNGTTGVFKLLENNTADVCIGNFVITSERIQLFDFIFPTHHIDVRVFIFITNHFKWTSYIAPFSWWLWLIIFSWTCLASLCILIVNTSLKFFLNEKSNGSIFIVLRALCYQSQEIKTHKFSFLTCLLMPYLIAVVIVQAYSGSLFSYLAVPDYTPPFQSLGELLDNGNYKIIMQPNGFIYSYFQSDGSAQSRLVREKFLLPRDLLPVRVTEGFHLLCENHKMAFVHVSPVNVTEKCKIIEISNPIFRRPMGIILRPHFPFSAVMNQQVKRIQESGLLGKTLKKNQIRQIVDEDSDYKNNQNFEALSFESILPLFFLLIGGLALAFIVFILEKIIIKSKRKYIHATNYYYWQKHQKRPFLKKPIF